MSSEVEEKSTSGPEESSIQYVQKDKRLPRFSYSRDFLLSLSESDICKKLPRGCDVSILSDTQRSLGGTYFQKRSEHGSHSYRLESSTNHSRGSYGRWDTRSSGSSDREELQSDRDSDSGRHYLNLSRHSWQHPEHDSLLGRPSGYSGQTSAQRPHGSSSYQLKRSTEPYQPPRPYKTAPYSCSSTDLFNDETFGTSKFPGQDRAEEEKRRRESFELMRREQRKSLQEKQQEISVKHNGNLDDNLSVLPENSDSAQAGGNEYSKKSLNPQGSQQNDSRSSVQQAPTPRPLVPPGFQSTALDKKILPPPVTSLAAEVEKFGFEDKHLTKAANGINDVSDKGTEGWEDVTDDSTDKEVRKVGALEVVACDQPTSILDKLFQSAVTRNTTGLSDFIEHQNLKVDDVPRSPSLTLSSKFVEFFKQDEKKPAEGSLSNALTNDKVGHQVSVITDANVLEDIPSDLPIVNSENMNLNTTGSSFEVQKQEPYYHCTSKPAENSDVLTCEYIEELMLAEANLESSSLQHSVSESRSELDIKSEPQRSHVDDNASLHLLSLLQQGTNMKDSTTLVNQDTQTLSENFCITDVVTSFKESGNACSGATSTVQSAENSVTLEALFGSAFMKELQSAEAPVSAQRGSAGESITTNIQGPHELQYSNNNDVNGSFPTLPRTNVTHTDGGISMLAYAPEAKSSGSESFQAADIYLPEEENLIIEFNAMHPRNSEFSPLESGSKREELQHPNAKDNIVNKLAALNSIPINDESPLLPGADGSHVLHGPYDRSNMNPSHQGLYGRVSSQFHHHMVSQMRPLVQQLDPQSHIKSQINFMGPENVHPDPHHPYPPNVIHHHSLNNPGGAQFNPASNFQMLQHMQLSGNFPLPQMHDYPRGMPPPHPFDHVPRFHELNQMNQFPFHHRQQSHGDLGMEMPGPGTGRGVNHSGTIESLYHQMEMRTNSRQNQFVPGASVPGNQAPGIDMGTRFR